MATIATKKIKAFEFRIGWGSEDETTNKVNTFITELSERGINDVTIDITSTGKGVIYTLIWDE